MMDNNAQWVVVVEPCQPEAAKREFQQWRETHPEWSARLKDIDIIIDIVRSVDETDLRRYRVRATVLRGDEVVP